MTPALVALSLAFLAAPSIAPCRVYFPSAQEPCAAIVTRTDGVCRQEAADLGWCQEVGQTIVQIYGYSPAARWPYWQTRWTSLNQVPEWPSCMAACQAIAPMWPGYAECCPSGPGALPPPPPPPPPPSLIFTDGFESGNTQAWSAVVNP